jgi:hypothetical protein
MLPLSVTEIATVLGLVGLRQAQPAEIYFSQQRSTFAELVEAPGGKLPLDIELPDGTHYEFSV